MNAILGMGGLLREGGLAPPYDDYAEVLNTSADGLLRIIDDILDFSKIEAGQLSLESTAFSLRKTLDLVMGIQADAAARKGIELRLTVSDDVPDWVKGDPLRLHQVVLNLVSNAIKFTAEGQVSVEVARDASVGESLALCFVVRDTGIGISQEYRALLFAPFTQADSSTTREFGGTGLGLAICKRIVEAMGGRIDVVSELGVGSEFWFVVEFEPAEAPPDAEAAFVRAGEAQEETPTPNPCRILLVEDNAVNQLVAMRHAVRPPATNPAGRLVAVETGHLAVHQDEVKVLRLQSLEGFQTIAYGFRAIAELLKLAQQARADHRDHGSHDGGRPREMSGGGNGRFPVQALRQGATDLGTRSLACSTEGAPAGRRAQYAGLHKALRTRESSILCFEALIFTSMLVCSWSQEKDLSSKSNKSTEILASTSAPDSPQFLSIYHR